MKINLYIHVHKYHIIICIVQLHIDTLLIHCIPCTDLHKVPLAVVGDQHLSLNHPPEVERDGSWTMGGLYTYIHNYVIVHVYSTCICSVYACTCICMIRWENKNIQRNHISGKWNDHNYAYTYVYCAPINNINNTVIRWF